MSGIDEYLRTTRILCNFLGVLPCHSEKSSILKKCFLIFRRVLSLLALTGLMVPGIIAVIENFGDVVTFTRIVSIFLTCFVTFFKMIYLILNGSELTRLYFTVVEIWDTGKTPEEKSVYEAYARKAKNCTIVVLVLGLAVVIAAFLSVIFEEIKHPYTVNSSTNRRLPFETSYDDDKFSCLITTMTATDSTAKSHTVKIAEGYGFDINPSPVFELLFVGQLISGWWGTVAVVGQDSIMLFLPICVSGQFALIRFWYQGIGSRMSEEESPAHEIKKLADQLENFLSPVIFVQLISSGTEICLCGYAATTGIENNFDLISFVNLFVVEMLRLGIWCIVGEILMQESKGVGDAAFHCTRWYSFPQNLQRDIGLVIRRSQKPCCLTAAKFQVINTETVNQVFNSAISYFMLLRQINDR